MKKLLASVAVLATVVTALPAQQTRVHSRPIVPSTAELDRLNLKLAWKAFMPSTGTRDGIDVIQIIGDMVFVQPHSGGIVALDAETGKKIWQTRFGKPYFTKYPLGWNYNSVFAVNHNRLYSFDRRKGDLQFDMELTNIPNGAPMADNERVFVMMTGGRLHCYYLWENLDTGRVLLTHSTSESLRKVLPQTPVPPLKPDPDPRKSNIIGPLSRVALGGHGEPLVSVPAILRPSDAAKPLVPKFELPLQWDYVANPTVERAPIMQPTSPEHPAFVPALDAGGVRSMISSPPRRDNPGTLIANGFQGLTGIYKFPNSMLYQIDPDSPVSAPMETHWSLLKEDGKDKLFDIAYIPFENGTLFAMDIDGGRIMWRYAGKQPIYQKPAVTDRDIFIIGLGDGMTRLNRANGEKIWRNERANRFLAVNNKFVYALDRSGRLLILDYARGTELTSFDKTRPYLVPVSNDLTDRVYLAAHDGLLICLRDREYNRPLKNKAVIDEKPPLMEPKAMLRKEANMKK